MVPPLSKFPILFCGTPEFAVPTLRRLIDSPFCPELVITQPDRPRGRGKKLTGTPVKDVALESGIRVLQPEKFNSDETFEQVVGTGARLAVVVAYSAKIGRRFLEALPEGWLNLHPSLLPAYRGAAPMQWALMRGERETGISTFFLNEAWDAGPICFQERLAIQPQETYGELSGRCAEIGAELVLRSVEAVAAGTAPRIAQDDALATFAPLLKLEDSRVVWSRPAVEIQNQVRGLTPVLGVFCCCNGKRLVLERTQAGPEDSPSEGPAGRVVQADRSGLRVKTGDGLLEILQLRPENRGSLSAREFLNGARLEVGSILEDGRA